jgi:hypothetical protein
MIIQVEVNGWWEWPLLASRCFSSGAATITREIAVKNRSHNLKTTVTKQPSFFLDLTGRFSGQRRCLYLMFCVFMSEKQNSNQLASSLI